MRRRKFILGAGVASMVLATGGSVMAFRSVDADEDDGAADESDGAAAAGSTAEVTRRDLEERQELDGTLGYGDTSQVSLTAQGTITALPALGTVVDRGQTLVEVDGLPVPLLFGDRPLWRQLGADVEDGVDIETLEANLVALGIASADELTVDQTWTTATTSAVKEWQESLGREETGVVSPGDAVLLPGAVRVAAHPTPVGGGAGGAVLEVTGTNRQVSIDLEATSQSLVTVDQPVEVELPDGSVVPGRITSIGRVAEQAADADDQAPGSESEPTIEVLVALDDPAAGGALDEAPVTVRLVTTAAADVLTVPVDALLALAEGGYAVELVEGGSTRLVAVETGAFADGWVEVTSEELAEGDAVVVPAS